MPAEPVPLTETDHGYLASTFHLYRLASPRFPRRRLRASRAERPDRAAEGCLPICVTICATRQIMRTTLNLDDEALAGALQMAPGKTKTEIINEALREFTRRRRLRGLLKFEGKLRWEGDLDRLRRRNA